MRIYTLSALALAAALSAGVASAQSVNAGVAQLAAIAGVAPDAYSQSQLVRLIDAQRDGDLQEIAFLQSQAKSGLTSSSMGNVGNAGSAQLAALAGVEPGLYSDSELQRLINAQRNQDAEGVRFILSGADQKAANAASVVTPGEEQIARVLGVDAAQYTLAELIAMDADRISEN